VYASHNTYIPNSRTSTTTFSLPGTDSMTVSLEVVQYCTLGMTSCAYASITGPGLNRTYTASTTTSIRLAAGVTYTLTATSPTSTQFSTASIYIRYRQVYQITGRKAGSGLRIAEVRTTDGHGGSEVKKYRYRLLSDSTFSSGWMDYEPVYMEHVFTNNYIDRCEFFSRTATSMLALGASSNIAYREVTVLHGENGEFGRTREVFRNSIDNPDNAPLTPKPNIRVSSTEGRSGQRLRATEYNASGQVQQRTESKFTFRWNDSLTTRRFRGMSLVRWTGYTGTFGTGYFPIETQYGFGAFEVTSEWGYQTADTVYTYDEAGNASVWTGRNYTYDNPQHQQVTQLDEGSSDGRRRITRMRYPSDYASVPLSSDPDGLSDGEAYAYALTRMKDSLHIHSPVIEKWISEVVGGTERVLQAEFAPWQTYLTVEGRSALPAGRMVLAAPGPVTDFTPGSIQGTWLIWDENRFLWHQQINGYDPYGRLREVVDENNSVYTYTYGGNAGSAFLTRISHSLVDGAPLVAETGYDSRGYRSWTRDEAGTLRSYTFDGFGRLVQVRNEAGTPLQGLAYTYSRTAANGWTYQPGTPNSVTDTTYLAHTPSVSAIVSTGYLDGLGRPVQTVLRDGASWHVTARQYDASGHTWRLWKPYTRTTGGYDASFAASATAFYNADLGVSNAQPFTDSLFTPDPLRRPRSLVSEYVGSTPTAVTTVAYGIDAASGLRYSETTDPAGKKTRSYVDGFGYSVRNTLGYGTAEASTAQVAFNALGQQTQLTDPRGIVTTYTRDTRGLMTTRANPDGGTRNVKYTRAGTVRFAQDARQAAAGRVWFTNYDNAGRPLVSGEGAAVFSSLDPREGNPEPMETATANWLLVRRYDAKPSTSAFPWSLFATQIAGLTLNNVSGRLAASASKSNGAWQAELFSYDADGEVAARYTFTQAGGGGVLAALNTTLTYTRDLRGEVTQRAMTVGANSFYQWYEFDGRGLLARVYASTSATRPAAADAAYTYRPAGGVRERQYQGGPLVPLRYTIREQIERIGDPASTAYPFSARYSYHPNGRLQETEFYSAGSPAASKRYGYVFGTGSWDALNRMRSADFSPWAGTGWSTTAAHDLTGITYDAAGNITVLGRYNQAGAVVDNLAYGYGTTTNRLGSVTDYAGATAEAWDAETGGFTYDANGNLLTAPSPYSISAATYDYQNLPLSFTAGGVTSTYRYNGEGQRIGRQVGAGNIDFYLKEGPATLGVMTLNAAGTPASWHFNLLAGDQVVGRLTNTGSRRYYHRDMNRSTRAVVENGLVVESYDYDPWGVLMPGRTLAGPTREGFTGKEYDPETGLTYFGARYYMAALGRWTSVDPSADTYLNWSPYNYVLGDPMLLTDPFGLDPCEDSKAWTDCIALWLAAWGARNGNNFALYGGAALSAGLEVTGINTAAAAGNDIGEGNFVEGLKGAALSVGATWLGGRLGASAAGRLAGSHVDEAAGAAAGRLGSEAVDHIVLGYADEGLRATAAKVGGRHLMEDNNWRRTVMDAAANGRARITVSLDGMTGANPAEKLMNAALRGSRPPAAGMAPRATDWEMSVLYEVRRFRNVDLVQTVDGVLQHVPNPFR
jgi:RHS repeat-associated protein